MIKYLTTAFIAFTTLVGTAQAQLGAVMYDELSKPKYEACTKPASSVTLETLLSTCESAVDQLKGNVAVATSDSPESFVDRLTYELAETEYRTVLIKKHMREYGAGKVCAEANRLKSDLGWTAYHTPEAGSSTQKAVEAIDQALADCKNLSFDIAPPMDRKLSGTAQDNPYLQSCQTQQSIESCQQAVDEMDSLAYWEAAKVRDMEFLGLAKADYSKADDLRFNTAQIILFQYQIAQSGLPKSLESMKQLCPYVERANDKLSRLSTPPPANTQGAQLVAGVQEQLGRCQNIDKMIQMQQQRR